MLKESKIKKIFLVLLLLASIVVASETKYDSFISKQIEYIDRLDDADITQDEIKFILAKQKHDYKLALEEIMGNKQKYLDKANMYDAEMFALEKIIKINKRASNRYAILRDEVQLKSYQILKNQHKMMQLILSALDDSDSIEFSKRLRKLIEKNKLDNEAIVNIDYKEKLELESNSKSLKQAKNNIKELYAILDISVDVLNYLHISENTIYRLNKYSKYNLISTVLLINSSALATAINPILEVYGLSVVKLLLITTLIILIYLTRKIIYIILESKIKSLGENQKYSREILNVLTAPLHRLIIVININMIVYVYNNFNSIDVLSKFFNMIYATIFTLIVYKIIKVVAKIKVDELDPENMQIKNDVINVGIKILNFIILIMGLLLVLHLAGANLTAVLSGLGIGGFAVALAAKDSLANFFGTLSILFSDVLAQGDWIVVNGQEGVVIEIGTRVTTLRTFDNALIAIPNAIIANQDVKNWNKRSLGRRIKMSLGIKYGASSKDIKSTVNEIRTMLDLHPSIATENTSFDYKNRASAKLVSKDDAQGIKKTLLVYLDEFSDSSINILVYCFTKSVDWQEWLETKEDVMHKIMEIFERNNIEFAFPSLSIYNENEK